jgi:hypothetical protein
VITQASGNNRFRVINESHITALSFLLMSFDAADKLKQKECIMSNNDQTHYPRGMDYREQIPLDQGPQMGGPITQSYGTGSEAKLPTQPQKPPNPWRTATFVLFAIVAVLALTTYLGFARSSSPTASGVTSVPTATQSVPQKTLPAVTATSTSEATQSATPIAQSPNNYAVSQPGPGCDKNGGTWTPQGFSKITCGTQLELGSLSNTGGRNYLFLQLPSNKAFSPNNTIGIIGNPYGTCFGLDE